MRSRLLSQSKSLAVSQLPTRYHPDLLIVDAMARNALIPWLNCRSAKGANPFECF